MGIITLNHPKVLNGIYDGLMIEVSEAARAFDEDTNISVTILTGSEKAFAGKQRATILFFLAGAESTTQRYHQDPKASDCY
ncbi:unnamed protein product, partial [Aphanomyces euteiches]